MFCFQNTWFFKVLYFLTLKHENKMFKIIIDCSLQNQWNKSGDCFNLSVYYYNSMVALRSFLNCAVLRVVSDYINWNDWNNVPNLMFFYAKISRFDCTKWCFDLIEYLFSVSCVLLTICCQNYLNLQIDQWSQTASCVQNSST